MKWAPAGNGTDLGDEVVRLAWAGTFTPVPRLIGRGCDVAGSWIITSALSGQNAAADQWKMRPGTAVRAIGEGLRALHDALPVSSCPFSWAAQDRLADVRRRASAARIDPASWHQVHRSLSLDQAVAVLADIPPADRLVVCHGDACAPNTLLARDGRWSAHVDLGDLGVADRWADLSVATWSTQWNYGPGWERVLLDAYGVQEDTDRIRYYRLLWDLGP